jgi:NifU-like protein involved in Fe-S cluster formation
MSYSNKVLDHYENPRNVGSFAKTTTRSAPAWSARRPAAT